MNPPRAYTCSLLFKFLIGEDNCFTILCWFLLYNTPISHKYIHTHINTHTHTYIYHFSHEQVCKLTSRKIKCHSSKKNSKTLGEPGLLNILSELRNMTPTGIFSCNIAIWTVKPNLAYFLTSTWIQYNPGICGIFNNNDYCIHMKKVQSLKLCTFYGHTHTDQMQLDRVLPCPTSSEVQWG